MKDASKRALLALALGALAPLASFGGVFTGTVVCDDTTGCAPGTPASGNLGDIINPQGIVYPITFLPAGTTSPNVRLCVQDAFNGNLSKAVQWAVDKWNALVPAKNNCVRCSREEIPDPYSGGYNLASTVLHEIGHCAMGLDHTTLTIDTDDPDTIKEATSYTVSYGGTSAFMGLLPGADTVRGSKDDTQLAQGGGRATNVHWFRRADNDPFVVDSTAIDSATYSRALTQLPAGSTYTANANIGVANLLGYSQSNTVMQRSFVRTQALFDLSADDVNTVRMSRTGLNRVVGPAGAGNDDHAIQLEVVSCAVAHDIEVSAGAIPVNGRCSMVVDYIFPADPHAVAQDFRIISGAVTLNSTQTWEFGLPQFYGSFESGNFDSWVLSP